MDRRPIADKRLPGLEPDRHLTRQWILAIPTRRMRHPLLLHRLRQKHIVLKRRTPSIVAPRYEFVTLIVRQCQKHTHAISLLQRLRIICADLFPSLFLNLLGIRLWITTPLIPLCKIALSRAPPRHIPMPTQLILFLPRIAPQQQTTQHHIFWLQPPVTPRMNKTQKIWRTVELRKTRLPESRMDKPPNRPRLIITRAVYIPLRAIDLAILILWRARLGHAAPRLAKNGNPGIIGKIVNNDKTVLLQMRQSLWRSPGSRKLRFEIGKSRSAIN